MKISSRLLLVLPCLIAGVVPASAAIDLDNDTLGDVWEQFYSATGLTASADADGDGMSNVQESLAGTNPLSAASKLDIALAAGPAVSQRTLSWPSVTGKNYFVEGSSNLTSWVQEGVTQSGTGSAMNATVTLPPAQGTKFYRIACVDKDTDSDAVSDWEEITACLNPNAVQTTAGTDDIVAVAAALTASGNVLTAVVIDGQAFEANTAGNTPEGGMIRLVRSGGLAALNVNYTWSGRPVSGDDYAGTYSGVAAFAFGCNQVDIPLLPVKDTHIEVPETLTFSVVTGSGYTIGMPAAASVRIDDFETQTETFYFAQLGPQTGATTNGSGYATIWLSGDHTGIRTSLTFTNLGSAQPEQDGAHLHYTPTREIVHHLESGQIVDDRWSFPENGTGSLSSDQVILDALTTNNLYVNVHTMGYPGGEVRGDFQLTQGSITFTPPADPGAPPAYTGPEFDRDVERLLSQATFGATDSLITAVKTKGIGPWIDEQMNVALTPQSLMLPYVKASDDWLVVRAIAAGLPDDRTPLFESLAGGWWIQAAAGRDQLRQRVAFALSEIFVVSVANSTVRNRHYGTADYYDMLARNAFGNFRTLLEDVTLHPIMANYLSMIKNQKYDPATGVSPDENYAREVMQLFTIGLVQLHPDGTLKLSATGQPTATYDNGHITELAKVFTGWSYSKAQANGAQFLSQWNNDGTITDNNNFNYGGGLPYGQAAFYNPLKMFQTRHDTGVKNIVNGVSIPANQSGDLDLDNAMDALFNHPNTPSFIARRLIQRLVTSNPSRGYVYRVANKFVNNGSGVRGDLGAVVRAILTDYEARSQTLTDQASYGKQREPMIAFLHLYRAMGGTSGTGVQFFDTNTIAANSSPAYAVSGFPAGTRLILIRPSNTVNQSLPQSPINAPSVFNWFDPDYTFPGEIQSNGLVAPEFQITNETNAVTNPNYFYGLIYNLPAGGSNPGPQPSNIAGANGNYTKLSISLTAATSAFTSGGATGLVDFYDRLFCSHQLSTDTRNAIITAVNGITDNTEKVRTALYLVINSPDYLIQR